MEFAIITSTKDPAGMNIKECLLELFDFKESEEEFEDNPIYEFNNKKIKLYTTNKETIYCENIDKQIDADLFVFATKHQSKEGIASLSCHSPGNWNNAEFGGKDKILCISPANLLKNAFLELKKLNSLENYNITLECTHHGPYLDSPVMFIEIGSSLQQWQNKEAGRIIANVIINILKKENNYKTAFGIGGPHYANNFNKIMERTNIAVGHICPKHMLQFLNKDMIQQAVEKTDETPEIVILDWKGLGTEKTRIAELLNKLNIKYKRTNDILPKSIRLKSGVSHAELST